MRTWFVSLVLVAGAAPAAAQSPPDARLREARDACWREQGYATPPANLKGRPGLGEEISACVRRRMSGGPQGGAARR